MPLSQKQIDVAVAWWCQALRDPVFDNLGPSNRDLPAKDVVPNLMASALARKCPRPDEAAVARFADALRAYLADPANADKVGWHGLSVDYSPQYCLYDVCKACGMDGGDITKFPWKTRMSFEGGGVQVSCGYAAPSQDLPLE